MRKTFLPLSFFLLLTLSSIAQKPTDKIPPKKKTQAGEVGTKTADLKSVIKLINESLKIAQADLEKHRLLLSEAEITLVTATEKSGGGGIKIFAKASGKWSKEITSTVTYKFAAPNVSADEKKAFTPTAFAKAIVSSAQSYRDAGPVAQLIKDGFEQEISFSIKAENGVGVEISLFGLVEIEGSADLTKTVAHSAKLTFKDMDKKWLKPGNE